MLFYPRPHGSARVALLALLTMATVAGLLRESGAGVANGLPAAAEEAATSIRVSDLRSHLLFVASDELQGRAVGTPGNTLAELYAASAFERLGLTPAGERFHQAFALYSGTLGPNNRLTVDAKGTGVSRPYAPGPDFIPSRLSAAGTATGEVVFAGYGISAPQFAYDDYDGLDARGKIVLVIAHEPEEDVAVSRFDGTQMSAQSGVDAKIRAAREHGAIGLLMAPDARQHAFRRRLGDPASEWPENPRPRQATYALAETVDSSGIPAAAISAELADELLAGADAGQKAPAKHPRTIEDAQRGIDAALTVAKKVVPVQAPASFGLPGRQVSLTVDIVRKQTVLHNVVGYIEGADPTLRAESVVLGAHLDHDGSDDQNRVYNGADDNGSGIVAVLEIAEAFSKAAEAGSRPARTVVFALWNGEEKGLFGSTVFVNRPVPAGIAPVANVNLDMIGRNEDVPDAANPRYAGLPATRSDENSNTMHILGYSYSPDMVDVVKDVNQEIGLELKTQYDVGAQRLLSRSDHWSFLEKKIPALFFTTGLHPDYHTVDDDVTKINFEKLEKIARLSFRAVWSLAGRLERPRFVEASAAPSGRH
jgi:hypothetical protein